MMTVVITYINGMLQNTSMEMILLIKKGSLMNIQLIKLSNS